MKTLYLLRHAKTESAKATEGDIDRKLTPRGIDASKTVGSYLRERGYNPAFVICSPARRTRETFELVMRSAGLAPPHRFEKVIYLATIDKIMDQITKMDDHIKSLMIVGHNPGMHHLAITLAQPENTDMRTTLALKYPTGALTVLRFAVDSWKSIEPGEGELIDFATPDSL